MADSAPTGPFGGWLHPSTGIAGSNFNRWLVPPAALAVHLCIGMAYGFSVFWLPMSHLIGGAKPLACPKASGGLLNALFTRSCDWTVVDLGVMYTLFFVILGAAAAVFGPWVERNGPRRTGAIAAVCWSGGMAISALGVHEHQLWLMWLGSGVIGGIGLGLGYISPVSTLIKWFPDKRGMATGMAIMGFGGGAMIGSPLADQLMKHFAVGGRGGVWETLLTLSVIYFVFMICGALGYRTPHAGWAPKGWTPPEQSQGLRAKGFVTVATAVWTPQFWLVWLVLLMNVSASIGIIGVASPMIQEVFGGRLIHHPELGFAQFGDAEKKAAATVGAAFVGLISLFNIGGRFFWSSLSDRIGRKGLYLIFFTLGLILYGFVAPWASSTANLAIFLVSFCVLVSMYGGGFAAAPAYLADLFGARYVGAIHGVLLTAWSTAGILGPQVVNLLRQSLIEANTPKPELYSRIFLVLAAMLAIGFVANLLIRPLDPAKMVHETATETSIVVGEDDTSHKITPILVLAWIGVLAPLSWGVWVTLTKAAALFH